MIPSLEIFGLLPYLEFEYKIYNNKIRKRIVNHILKKYNALNIYNYLESKFINNIYFYAIDANCWNDFIDPERDVPDYIDNSKIAEEIISMTEGEKYKIIESERINKQFEEESKIRENMENKKNKVYKKCSSFNFNSKIYKKI